MADSESKKAAAWLVLVGAASSKAHGPSNKADQTSIASL